MKQKLNLYKRIFPILWHEKHQQNANHITDQPIISGFIDIHQNQSQCTNISVKEFAFNTQEMSHFDLVNEMWKLSDIEIENEFHDLQKVMNLAH